MQNIEAGDCTIIVPAYNEEKRIKPFLNSLSSFKGTIIFVCDGTDRTSDVIRSFSERKTDRKPEVICLDYNERLGKGGGITAGILNSKTEYVGFTDADGSTSESEMIRLFSYLSDYDCAIGSRWMKESDVVVKQPLSRRVH
jgi:glycosyltransferase involved in cell wall biosynthesis